MLNNELINKYTEMVDLNNYAELLVEVATDLKIDHYKKLFESILNIHNLEGHLKPDLYELRTRLVNEFLDYLQSLLSEKDYATIKQFV